jgi:hypothetical protein
MTIEQVLADPVRRDRITTDCVRLVEEEVAAKRGFTGMALRTGFAAFQRLQPGIVRLAVERLLPDFARALAPHWEQARGATSPEAAFASRTADVARDLLGVTDRIVERARSSVVGQIYRSLRPSAQDHVAAAVPRLGRLLQQHLS